MTNKEIEDIINKIASERKIEIEYINKRIVRVSSSEFTLVGSRELFDKAMIEVAQKYKIKQ